SSSESACIWVQLNYSALRYALLLFAQRKRSGGTAGRRFRGSIAFLAAASRRLASDSRRRYMKGLRPFPFLGMGLVLCVLMTACGGRAPQNGPSGLFVATSTLQNGVVGDTYSQTLFATGGLPPYTWSIDSGSLPVGLSLSSSGVIAGTTTVAGDSAFTVRVTDSQSPTKAYNTAYLTITVNPALTLPPTNLPNGTIGVAYSQAVAATGGLKPYIYSLAPNSAPLPSGLTL